MWIETGTKTLPAKVAKHLDATLTREDNTDHVWVNLDTGALLVLACNGGWRSAESAFYKLFLYAPGAEPYDVTFAVLGARAVPFDVTKKASETWSDVYDRATSVVGERIGAKTLF